jgi:hypothetical protein
MGNRVSNKKIVSYIIIIAALFGIVSEVVRIVSKNGDGKTVILERYTIDDGISIKFPNKPIIDISKTDDLLMKSIKTKANTTNYLINLITYIDTKPITEDMYESILTAILSKIPDIEKHISSISNMEDINVNGKKMTKLMINENEFQADIALTAIDNTVVFIYISGKNINPLLSDEVINSLEINKSK